MLGGTALCVTSLALAWQVIGRKLRHALAEEPVLVRPETRERVA